MLLPRNGDFFWKWLSIGLISAVAGGGVTYGCQRAAAQDGAIVGHAEIVAYDTIRVLCKEEACPKDVRLFGYRIELGECWSDWKPFPLQDDTENGVRMQTRGQYRTAYDCRQHAAETLATIIGGKIVSCAPAARDRFGMTVAKCLAMDETGAFTDISAEMLKRSHTMPINKYGN